MPVLPIRSENNHQDMGILYPTRDFKGVYFSEELKLALIYGYEFEKEVIFDDLVKNYMI